MTTTWTHVTRGIAHEWHCDDYGHGNIRYFAHFFDDAGFALWDVLGIGPGAMAAEGVHTVIARTETDVARELRAGQTYAIEARVHATGTSSLTIELRLLVQETREVHAQQRVVEVFFDPTWRSAPTRPIVVRCSRTTG